jgi:hypothetical protein
MASSGGGISSSSSSSSSSEKPRLDSRAIARIEWENQEKERSQDGSADRWQMPRQVESPARAVEGESMKWDGDEQRTILFGSHVDTRSPPAKAFGQFLPAGATVFFSPIRLALATPSGRQHSLVRPSTPNQGRWRW